MLHSSLTKLCKLSLSCKLSLAKVHAGLNAGMAHGHFSETPGMKRSESDGVVGSYGVGLDFFTTNSNHDSDFELKVQQSAGGMDATQLFIHKNMSWFSFHASAARFCLVLWCLTTDMPALRGVASFALLPQQPLVAGKSAESKLRLEKLFRKSDFVGDGPFQSDAKNTPRTFARAAQEKKDEESDDSGNISSESNDESNSPTNPSNINDVDENGEGETTERDNGSMKVGDESLVISPPLKTNKVLPWNDPNMR
jgi:hypothetical protein